MQLSQNTVNAIAWKNMYGPYSGLHILAKFVITSFTYTMTKFWLFYAENDFKVILMSNNKQKLTYSCTCIIEFMKIAAKKR